MRATSHAPFYDLFKLIVAIILLVIFLFLIWNRPMQPLQPIPPAATSTPPPPTPTIVSPTSTPVPPTTTLEPSETATQTATLTPPPTAAVTDEPLPTPIVEVSSDEEACTAYARSQLEVGMEATIQRRLNFRSFPGLFNNLILTNNPGTEVEIVGGPVCTRYQEGGAYLWWQIKLPDGLIGWSAEASAFGAFYFMEPTE